MKHCLILARLACLLSLMVAPSASAAPVNDHFADRLEVFNGSSNAVTGSNVDATTEAGEPVPAGYTASTYQGTVWYVFKPAADIWYEINTVGSAFDTVLALWTGTGLNDLALVHVNNEATEGGVSRIRFQSHGAPDVSYFISVAGRNAAARGGLTLTVQPGGNQMIVPEPSVSVSPSTVNVSNATANTTVGITMSVTSDVLAGYVKLYAPDGRLIATSTYSVGNRVSGTNASGVYNVNLTVPRYIAPGTYLLGIGAQNAVSNPSKADSYGWDQMTAMGVPVTLAVQNTGPMDTYYQFTVDNNLSGGGAAMTADPDGDVISNLMEFGFGMDPNVKGRAPLKVTGGTLTQRGMPNVYVVGTGSQQRLRLEFIRRVADQALTYRVEFSDDLETWTPATNAAVVVATAGGYEAVTVDDVTTGAARPRRFAHVVVTYQLP